MSDREDIEAIRRERDAGRWRKLVRLCGFTQNSSEATVKLFWDDATNTAHIMVDKKMYGTDQRSFESVIDSIEWPEW